jgi:hypothetical protein
MNFSLEKYGDYISLIFCWIIWKLKNANVKNINKFLSKSGGKHILNVKFSYVATIYEMWNINNILNVLFTPCAINILLFLSK